MPGTYSHAMEMASYNVWQNEVLYRLCGELEDEERKRERGMFFRSLHDTLDHILMIDRLLFALLEGDTPLPMRLSRLYDDFEALRAARVEMDTRLCRHAAGWSDAWQSEEIAIWSQTLNRERRLPRGRLVSQMFNHQTHHRSQVTTHLHLMGIAYGNTDVPFNPALSD